MKHIQRLGAAKLDRLKYITVVGIHGAIGRPIVHALVQAGLEVQVLSRGCVPRLPVTTRMVDYNDSSRLRDALEGQDAVVSCLGDTLACARAQEALIKASAAVGVKRFMPSEFGSDTTHPYVRRLPFFRHKVHHQEMLQAATAKSKDFSYTILITGLFLDWCLSAVPCIINVGSRTAQVYDGGAVPFSATRTSTVSSAVVKILSSPELSRNKTYKIHELVTTQNELIRRAKSMLDLSQSFRLHHVNTTMYEQRAWQAFTHTHSNPLDWIVPFINLSVWSKHQPGYFRRVDNDALKLPTLTDEARSTALNSELLKAIRHFSLQRRAGLAKSMTTIAEEAYEAGRMKLVDATLPQAEFHKQQIM